LVAYRVSASLQYDIDNKGDVALVVPFANAIVAELTLCECVNACDIYSVGDKNCNDLRIMYNIYLQQ